MFINAFTHQVIQSTCQSVLTLILQSCSPHSLNCVACMFLLSTALGLSQASASASFLLGTYRLNVRTLFVRILCDLVCHLCLGYYEFLLERSGKISSKDLSI